ncbi:MAG: rhomboid family intramembrane serine protease [Chitinophagaceae bacterium]
MTFSLTLVIIVATCIVSFIGFSNRDVINKLIFYPPAIDQNKEWYRFFSHGLIHADVGHLFFNMFALYSFGNVIEQLFEALFGRMGLLAYLLFYVSALAVSSIPTYLKNRNNSYYMSLGASGAVSSLVFAFMLFAPTQKIGILFLPFGIPAFIFGFLYVALSAYLDKKGTGNINHSAHLFGALYGIVFIVAASFFVHYPLLTNFIEQIKEYVTPTRAANPFG